VCVCVRARARPPARPRARVFSKTISVLVSSCRAAEDVVDTMFFSSIFWYLFLFYYLYVGQLEDVAAVGVFLPIF